ncbi:MAG: Ribosomal protein S18 acetylase RimI [Chloroflexi bacterium]|nr:MAG: Ribosomal protein S18 acetylase RimI [Chloroflexota bacterium]
MRPDETDAVVRLWHATTRVAYPYLPTEQAHTLDDARAFFRDHIAPTHDLFVAEADGALLGYMALKGSYIDRLYIHPDVQRSGAGTALLVTARARSPHELALHTHQQNTQACAFYEKHGFVAVKYGISPPPESAPDVEYHWRPTKSEAG